MYDFGAAKCFKGTCDRVNDTQGTYSFFPPEIVSRPKHGEKVMYAKRCDIWAAGITLFSIAALRNPFNEKNDLPTLVDSIVNDEIDYSELDPKFSSFLKRMLNKDQEARATVE